MEEETQSLQCRQFNIAHVNEDIPEGPGEYEGRGSSETVTSGE